MNEQVIAQVFSEWKTRFDANPEGFQSWAEFIADGADTYGPGAAKVFLAIKDEMFEYDLESDRYVLR